MRNQDAQMLLWLDLETTGLEPSFDKILEGAFFLSDFSNPFEAITQAYSVTLAWNKDVRMDETVWKMHTESGLIETAKSSTLTLSDLEERICALISPYDKKPYLAGSTIDFDKRFVEFWMPKLHSMIHYRRFDVTMLKLYCQSKGMPKLEKAGKHRALDDIRESIAHGMQCDQWLMTNAQMAPIAVPDSDGL